jgi:vacuolar-type H+-ATPase subunit I/STV1
MTVRDSRPNLRKYLAFAVLVVTVVVPPASNAQAAIAVKRSTLQEPAKKTPDAIAQPSQDSDEIERLQKSIRRLTAEVERLARRVADLEKERLFDVTRVLLVGEEQRAESLQARLRENSERQYFFQTRLDQLDNQLKPENIERMFVGVGMVRPEEARDTVRRRLSFEKQGLLAQLELLRQERNRFQAALASADMTIQRLRLRLAEAGRP